MPLLRKFAAAGLALLVAIPALAQDNSLDLTVNGSGISIGDSREVKGLRLNYRDRNLRRVDGVNATIWMPYEHPRGLVEGVALGPIDQTVKMAASTATKAIAGIALRATKNRDAQPTGCSRRRCSSVIRARNRR